MRHAPCKSKYEWMELLDDIKDMDKKPAVVDLTKDTPPPEAAAIHLTKGSPPPEAAAKPAAIHLSKDSPLNYVVEKLGRCLRGG